MPATTLVPDGSHTLNNWTNGGGQNDDKVDEGVSTPDDANTEIHSDPNDQDEYTLGPTPGDFDVAVDFKLRGRGHESGMVDDVEIGMVLSIRTAAGGLIGAEETMGFVNDSSYATREGAVQGNTDDKTTWDGYIFRMVSFQQTTGMPDAAEIFVTAVEVLVNYDVAATQSFPDRIAGNLRQAVRRAMRRAA